MQLPPPSVLANYPPPNYVDPVTRGPSLIVVNIVLFFVTSILITIRIYTRLYISRSFGIDDIFILLAMVPAAALLGMSIYAYYKFGGTRHIWDVDLRNVTVLLKFSLVTQIIFGTAVTLVKISMLLLTRKIMASNNKVLQYIITFAITYVTAGNVCFTLVMIFQCTPVSAFWTISFAPQNCINAQVHLLVAGIQNIISDFLVVLIPIPVVLKLNMRPRQRAIVILLFSAGFCVCVAGVVRTVYAYHLTNGHSDFTWDSLPVYIAGAVELYVGIICASIPPTKAFFSRYIPKLLTVSSQLSSSNSRSNRMSRGDTEKGVQLSDLTGSTATSGHWQGGGSKTNSRAQNTLAKSRGLSISFVDVTVEPEHSQQWRRDNNGIETQGSGSRSHTVQKADSEDNLIGHHSRDSGR